MGYLAYKRDEAAERLREARQMQSRVEDTTGNLVRTSQRVGMVATEDLLEARGFLKQKIAELDAYVRLQPDADGLGFSSSGGVSQFERSTASTDSISLAGASFDEANKIPLPEGYKWLRLDDLSPVALGRLPAESDFTTPTYEEMTGGLKMLESDILPVLKSGVENATGDYFNELDDELGREIPNGSRKIFDAFFGKDHVRVERFSETSKYHASGDGKYGITNGQHRIKTAMDLGWRCIPAEVIDVD